MNEIGSYFHLDKNKKFPKKKINMDLFHLGDYEDIVFTSSGRNAIHLILNEIKYTKNDIALLPAFTCDSVIKPFLEHNYKVIYYNIDLHMNFNIAELFKLIKEYNPTIFLFHRYFGFDTLEENFSNIINLLHSLNCVVIEDITHSLYIKRKKFNVDYYIGSLRKWFELPDGGIAVKIRGKFNNKPNSSDLILIENKLEALNSKFLYLKGLFDKNKMLMQNRYAEKILEDETEVHLMSGISTLIQANIDINYLIKRRYNNYFYLHMKLASIDSIVIPFNLIDTSVPLYFPILIKDNRRNELQKFLIENFIYAPIIWPQPEETVGFINGDSKYIYDHILCIPCDQRYDITDMENVVKLIEIYFKKGE